MPVNLRNMIETLSHERYMGAIIYGQADIGKTRYIEKFLKIHKDLNLLYIDVQMMVADKGDTQMIFELTPKKFLEWCLNLIPKEELEKLNAVIIDNFDFLVNLWDATKQKEFIIRIEKLEKAVFPKPLVAVLQEDSVFKDAFNKHDKTNFQRVVQFKKLQAI